MALSMGYGLIQDQRMKLVMTPELRQAIQVLTTSAVDLIQYIQDQAVENPVLEIEDSADGGTGPGGDRKCGTTGGLGGVYEGWRDPWAILIHP